MSAAVPLNKTWNNLQVYLLKYKECHNAIKFESLENPPAKKQETLFD